MLDKSKIIEQVKKLLEVNQSNGATEAEEKIALEKANMLIEKYQIEKYQLKSKSSNTHEYFVPKKKYPLYLFNGVINLIAEYFGCIAFSQGKKTIVLVMVNLLSWHWIWQSGLNLRWRLKSRNLSVQRIILPAKDLAPIAW